MKRFFRKALIGLARFAAILLVILVIFYAEEDWRGARDWAACQKELAAKGETLDLRQLAPPGKPEDDLSKIPIFAAMYQMETEQDYEKKKKFYDAARIFKIDAGLDSSNRSLEPKSSNYFKGDPIDLVAWQKYYRSMPEAQLLKQIGTPAQDVLQALSQLEPEMKEIDTAVSNPNAYWPINYENPLAGYLGGVVRMIKISQVIQLRGVAHLANNETDLGEKSYLFSFRLSQPLTKGCFTVNYLVIVATRTYDDAILWEGLHRHDWNNTQLHEMESALASIDMLALGADCFRIEGASMLQTLNVTQGMNFDQLKSMISQTGNEGLILLALTSHIRPSGWWNQDRSTCYQGIQKGLQGFNLNRGTLSPDTFAFHVSPNSEGFCPDFDTNIWHQIYYPISEWFQFSFRNFNSKIAKAETYRRLARLACRLEEYRIAHGQYPDKLDDLPDLPAHLNQEVLSENPLQYHRKGDSYLLYSTGWNQKDDGGILAKPDNETQGDWPWPSP